MKMENEENKRDAANFPSNPGKSFEAGKKGTTASTDEAGKTGTGESTTVGKQSQNFSKEESAGQGRDRGPGSNMHPSSQNLSEAGKKEDQPRGGNPTKAQNKSEEGKGWAIDGRDHIET